MASKVQRNSENQVPVRSASAVWVRGRWFPSRPCCRWEAGGTRHPSCLEVPTSGTFCEVNTMLKTKRTDSEVSGATPTQSLPVTSEHGQGTVHPHLSVTPLVLTCVTFVSRENHFKPLVSC